MASSSRLRGKPRRPRGSREALRWHCGQASSCNWNQGGASEEDEVSPVVDGRCNCRSGRGGAVSSGEFLEGRLTCEAVAHQRVHFSRGRKDRHQEGRSEAEEERARARVVMVELINGMQY
ncbi:unnamed protein product [Caretta caretta]